MLSFERSLLAIDNGRASPNIVASQALFQVKAMQ